MAAAASEDSSSVSAQQQEELDPIMHLANDMFHKTADYLNGEFDSTYLLTVSYFVALIECCNVLTVVLLKIGLPTLN